MNGPATENPSRERARALKLRRLEQENKQLREHRDRLERLLATALQIATVNADCGPLDLLEALELLEERAQASEQEQREFLALLKPLRHERADVDPPQPLPRASQCDRCGESIPLGEGPSRARFCSLTCGMIAGGLLPDDPPQPEAAP